MNRDLISYYRDRAGEYDKLYEKSERQADLATISTKLQGLFAGQNIMEIACGTGYWTERIAKTAASVFATDINDTMLAIAQARQLNNVSFRNADLFHLHSLKKYEGIFGGFILSHITRQDMSRFLQVVNSQVQPGGTVVLIDNVFNEKSSTPIAETDISGNTYQKRVLDNGAEYLILKNFHAPAYLQQHLMGVATQVRITTLEYYFILSYKTV